MTMTDIYKVSRAIVRRHQFIENKDSILVGVSGGVDSMVLASLLIRLQKDIHFKLALAHVNYGLRGNESDAQEKLVRDFAKRNRVECFVTRAEVPKKPPENFQAAARQFRYHYFSEVAVQIGASKVAVAHHLEDQVETILAQLLRGSSLRGLGGMRSMREMVVSRQESVVRNQSSVTDDSRLTTHDYSIILIRPLLTISKEQLKTYAVQNNVPFIEDSSNISPKYWRNRLRHELLPVIQKLRPKAFEKIVRLGKEMQELSDFLQTQAKVWLEDFAKKDEKSFWIPRPRWIKLPKTLRLEVFHQAASQFKGNSKNLKQDHLLRCEQLSLGPKKEGYYSLPESLRFIRSGDALFFKQLL